MRFTGKNLLAVEFALNCACDEIHNQIVTCPDPQMHAAELEDYETQLRRLVGLRNAVAHAIALATPS